MKKWQCSAIFYHFDVEHMLLNNFIIDVQNLNVISFNIAIFSPFGRAESHRIFRLAARRSDVPRLPRLNPESAAISARVWP